MENQVQNYEAMLSVFNLSYFSLICFFFNVFGFSNSRLKKSLHGLFFTQFRITLFSSVVLINVSSGKLVCENTQQIKWYVK